MSIKEKIIKMAKAADELTGSASTKFLINQMMGEYGKIINLNIDHKNKNITASILLKGENKPVNIKINKYKIIKEGATAKIILENTKCDRAWINALLKNFVTGKPIEIPVDKIKSVDNFLD